MLAPKEEAHRIAAYVPRWGAQLTANWSESKAWATYRRCRKNTPCSSAIASRSYSAAVLGLGSATRYKSASLTTTAAIWKILQQAHCRRWRVRGAAEAICRQRS